MWDKGGSVQCGRGTVMIQTPGETTFQETVISEAKTVQTTAAEHVEERTSNVEEADY